MEKSQMDDLRWERSGVKLSHPFATDPENKKSVAKKC